MIYSNYILKCSRKLMGGLTYKKDNIKIDDMETITKNITIILDNGHGIDTPGKRSPVWTDGSQLFEYEFNRDVVSRIVKLLTPYKIKTHVLVTEIESVPLNERVNRINKICNSDGAGNCLMISIHSNAGGGTGWECFTTKNKTKSDEFAEILYQEAEKMWANDWKIRKDTTDGDSDKEENFTIIYGANCPAVLIENFFMDTKRDCKYIMSNEGRDACAKVVLNAVLRWCS